MTKAAELAKMGEVLTNSQIGGRRNIIINGAMTIDQRNSGSSINLGNGKFYAVDRFYWIEDSSETPTGQQVTDAPDGFTHSVKITNTSTTTTPSYTQLVQPIEGNNVSQLYFGNSSAQNMTLSFYVKSSLTGQFSVAFRNGADNRSNVSTYTINSANTWERKIITFVGDTTGTYATDNTVGLNLIFRLDDTGGTSTLNQWTASANAFASGSVRFMGNASATWQVTGVQLEVGSQATPFEHRSFGEELQLCKRYTYVPVAGQAYGHFGGGFATSSTISYTDVPLPVEMRTNPAVTANGSFRNYAHDGGKPITTGPAVLNAGSNTRITFQSTSSGGGMTNGDFVFLGANNDVDAYLLFDAEL
jgi:hypothetical protein